MCKKAIVCFRKQLEAEPDSWMAHRCIARLYLNLNQPLEALYHMKETSDFMPFDETNNCFFAVYHLMNNDLKSAYKSIHKSLDRHPDSILLKVFKALVQFRFEKYKREI